ncbi:UDP-2,4-diacetamido-2,4,6-trideoxy-beta-L-altropyranose hydrolase [Sulfurospirillum deleyianum]|uniref:Pseudaminic acid biosynthesis-associated protein PseG n=1 Tax=Sulfurospirillum deleyianum (strain ATCC 51133 / DSM 6946 / 5175) TaxID=525898 RepID=D1B553_SULD5|nr:UDP-2,4-diacetamido-2,4,6-trideoxy-beta-L-altropyranose hydrolase [Sulfurospirillum deleyianum]ACZ13223.1 pseudaminic acid biosynthesis-associated protein PseG [Sulfurospirillum deleyianum DSM 6946]
MTTLIRADSSSTIGLGHIMRDVVLAKEFKEEVFFACQNLEGNIIEHIPYEVKILQSNDVDELIALIKSLHVTLLVIDHYGIDAIYEQTVKEATGVKILSLDDTYEKHHCDILLNPNVYADASRYEAFVPKGCELRCGKPLIREEFHTEKTIQREKIYDVCIAMGGSDSANITLGVLKTLPSTLHVSILTTTANAHLKDLHSFVADKPNIALHVNSNEVAKVLHQSCFVITTPSVMVQEVLFMELPFLAIQTAQNQEEMATYLQQKGYPVLKEWNASSFMRLYNAQ